MEKEKQVQMHINIAGQRISLNVDFDAQNDVRDAEDNVCKLYNKWKKQFPFRTDRELLAMISYQFAYFYITLGKRYDAAASEFSDVERRVDELLQ